MIRVSALAFAGMIFAAWLTDLELTAIGTVCRLVRRASAAVTLGRDQAEGVGVARLLAAPVSGDVASPGAVGPVVDGGNRGPRRPRGVAGA